MTQVASFSKNTYVPHDDVGTARASPPVISRAGADVRSHSPDSCHPSRSTVRAKDQLRAGVLPTLPAQSRLFLRVVVVVILAAILKCIRVVVRREAVSAAVSFQATVANDVDVDVLKAVCQLQQAYSVDHEDAIRALVGLTSVTHPRNIVRVVINSERLPAVPAQVLTTCRAIEHVTMHRRRPAAARWKWPTAPGQCPQLVVFCVSLFVLCGSAQLADGDTAAVARFCLSVADIAKRKQAKAALLLFRIVLAVRRDANQLPRRQPNAQADVFLQAFEQVMAGHESCRECEERRRRRVRAVGACGIGRAGDCETSGRHLGEIKLQG